ncbi:hypothetical protein KUTeg_014024 [Tegillarca granosa]|uniref:Cyclic nucleotide-binding domain-containing protein n=1 Tax=Tegillarca granosa TaxID=220873 RepID=A0ABQ9F0K5_TEGGR|nr:hypothetical protein KUTeg_014024 [Tegillarca granosa]
METLNIYRISSKETCQVLNCVISFFLIAYETKLIHFITDIKHLAIDFNNLTTSLKVILTNKLITTGHFGNTDFTVNITNVCIDANDSKHVDIVSNCCEVLTLPHDRTLEDLEIIYEELLHIKALSHLSTMVKRELASVLVFESHAKAGTTILITNLAPFGTKFSIDFSSLNHMSKHMELFTNNNHCTMFNQGDEGKSWYIILKGSVNVVIYGKSHF